MARRSRPTLAAKPPLSLTQNRVWPISPILDQTRADRVLQDIARFFIETFVMAQPVLKIISLPLEPESPRSPPFPFPDTLGHIHTRRNSKNNMHMVRHDAGGMNPPNSRPHSMPNRIQQAEGCCGNGKWFLASILGAAGDEKHSRLPINPQRQIMRQRLAADIHSKSIRGNVIGEKKKMGQTSHSNGASRLIFGSARRSDPTNNFKRCSRTTGA